MRISRFVHITERAASLNGRVLETQGSGLEMLADLFRRNVPDYPKFFKMDPLCKLGLVASELLVKDDGCRFIPRDDRAVLLFSRSGCIADDLNYQETIGSEDYYPSPSLFVYTLPNIVTGEIAIRNKYQGDTTAFGLPAFDAREIEYNVRTAFEDRRTSSAVCGWVECGAADRFEAFLMLVTDEDSTDAGFSAANIEKLKER